MTIERTDRPAPREGQPPIPAGPFDIIYADPPWAYDNKMNKDGIETGGSAREHYPTMSYIELAQMRPEIALRCKTNCLLFLWATGPHLVNAITLGESWNFRYVTVAFVWSKLHASPGNYTMPSTEVCLVFKRGRIPQPRGARNIRQLVERPITSHSEKPIAVKRGITRMFPTQRKLELFARTVEREPTWEHWGNETVEVDHVPDAPLEFPRESA